MLEKQMKKNPIQGMGWNGIYFSVFHPANNFASFSIPRRKFFFPSRSFFSKFFFSIVQTLWKRSELARKIQIAAHLSEAKRKEEKLKTAFADENEIEMTVIQ